MTDAPPPSTTISEVLQFEAIVAEAVERVMSFHPKEARAGVLRQIRKELAQCLAQAPATNSSPEAEDLRARLAVLLKVEEGGQEHPASGR